MATLVILRHGESRFNKEHRFSGWTDVELSTKGIAQSQKAGSILKEKGFTFDVAYTSMLQRAEHTLRYILAELGLSQLPVHRTWQLNERGFGALEGLQKTEAVRRFGEETVHRSWQDYLFKPPELATENTGSNSLPTESNGYLPQAESVSDCAVRVLAYWQDNVLPALASGSNVLLVAHGGVLKVLIKYLEDISYDETASLSALGNAVPVIYEFSNDHRILQRYYLDMNSAATALFPEQQPASRI